MTSRDFAFWLMGFFEIQDPKTITQEQTEMIKKHLSLVFKHEIDPSMGDEKHQQILNEIHHGKKNSFKFPTTEAEAVAMWGPKPSPFHVIGMFGWQNQEEGLMRC